MRRYGIALVAGALVFTAATSFAASLSLTGTSLGAGNASTASCNASATVSFNTSYSATLPGYIVTTTPVTTAAACASKAFKVTLYGSSNTSLGEVTGTLNGSGSFSPDFTSSNVSAASVLGISVVITG